MREKVAELLYLMETARGTTSFRYWGALKEQEKKIYLMRADKLIALIAEKTVIENNAE